MKKSKYADKIVDLVEDTLQKIGHSDDFTIGDNLDTDDFSITLEHDASGRHFDYNLAELYHTKEEEDIRVKDQYRDHLKNLVVNFVNQTLETIRQQQEQVASRYDEDEYDDEEEEYEDIADYGEDTPLYDDEEDEYEDEEDDYEEDEPEEERGFENPIVSEMAVSGSNEHPVVTPVESKQDVNVISSNDVFPEILKNDRIPFCVFVSTKDGDTEKQVDEEVISDVVKKFNNIQASDLLFTKITDDTMVAMSGMTPEYLRQFRKDAPFIKDDLDDTVYRFDRREGGLVDVDRDNLYTYDYS